MEAFVVGDGYDCVLFLLAYEWTGQKLNVELVSGEFFTSLAMNSRIWIFIEFLYLKAPEFTEAASFHAFDI